MYFCVFYLMNNIFLLLLQTFWFLFCFLMRSRCIPEYLSIHLSIPVFVRKGWGELREMQSFILLFVFFLFVVGDDGGHAI